MDARIGAGIDVVHDRGLPMASVKVGWVSMLAWNADNFGVGLTVPIGRPDGLNFGLGGIAVYRTDSELIGTHLNFLVRASYCWTRICASFAHISHGRVLGIDEQAANASLNFLYLEYRLK